MLTNLPEESAWAAGMAARLRLVQVSCADAPPGQRRQFLRDILTQAVNVLPAARRNNCLAALAERFPAWGTAVTPPAPPAALTPEEMVQYLSHFVKDLGVNVVGGCCGTTKEHIRQLVQAVQPAEKPVQRRIERRQPRHARLE